ncbi:MAG: hypothetical protein U1E89_00955 [Burkholderiaceae bacterium]
MTSKHLMTAVAAVAALMASPLAATAADKAKHPAAKPTAPAAPLSAEQLATAERVLTGQSSCEFDQSVNVAAVPDKKGHFHVQYKGQTFDMVPEATTTGAVRLEDKKAGMMWLQIANKSMLMNSKIGQRMVDNCVHPSQRA